MFRCFPFFALALAVLISLSGAVQATEALTPTPGEANPLEVTLPAAWTKDVTTLTVVEVLGGPVATRIDRTALFKFEWKPEANSHAVLMSNRVKRAAKYSLEAVNRNIGENGKLSLDFELFGTTNRGYLFRTTPVAQPAEQPTPALGLAGNAPANAAEQVGEKKGSIAELVITEAANWDTSGEAGRRRYVKRFDTYPISSCREIARIFRETADELAADESFENANRSMRTKIEEFYKRGDSKYRTRNPLREDWQPFLLHLEKRLQEQFSATTLADPNFAKFVLGELAEGFDKLADVWVEAAVNAGPHDVNDQPGVGSSNTTYGSDGASGSRHCPRCRKHCRCGRLLFGF